MGRMGCPGRRRADKSTERRARMHWSGAIAARPIGISAVIGRRWCGTVVRRRGRRRRVGWKDRGVRIDGLVLEGYEAVGDALAGCGPGVAVAAFVGGRRVVDV